MSWKDNAIMFWADENGDFQKISDHGRSPLSESYERIEQKTRMADGTLRRYTVAKKRTWTTSWSNLPSTNASAGMKTVDGGWSGKQMENYFQEQDGPFLMVLRNGSAINKTLPTLPASTVYPYENDDFYIARVMFSDFSKDVTKRGASDLWEVNVTLEEV